MKKILMITVAVMLGLFLLSGCGGYDKEVAEEPATPEAAPPPPPAEPVAVADDDLSYRNEPLMDDSGTPAPDLESPDPGESELVGRSFENAPPVIPHNTDGLLPISADENTCIECHHPDEAADLGAVAVPASHLYDIRRDKQLDDINPANYNCTLCHAPQLMQGDLVANDFDPYFRATELKEKSNLLDTLNEGVE